MTECYYFGVIDKSLGHALYDNRPQRLSRTPQHFPVGQNVMDGGLLPPGLPQEQGRAEHIHFTDWTVLAFWDRSADGRPNSNSAFFVRGRVSFLTACQIAQDHFPHVWARFKFHVRPRIDE